MIELFRKHISLHGCGRSTKAIVMKVLDLVAAGRLKPVIFKAFDLGQAGDAQRIMDGRNFFGRMLMHVWGNA
jgi:NADPH:quinone reductase-like Zn-dependent oxidoreductase